MLIVLLYIGEKVKFSTSTRQYEMDVLGRFQSLRPNEERKFPHAPWVCTAARVRAIDALVGSGVLRVPSGWPPVRKLEHVLFMKTSECLLLAGDVGCYLLRLMDLQEAYKEKFIELLLLLKRYTSLLPKLTCHMFCMSYEIMHAILKFR
jgi:hypothetical protein